MPKPLSNDLREHVVAFVEAGHSRRAAAVHFGVSPSFAVNQMALLRQAGCENATKCDPLHLGA